MWGSFICLHRLQVAKDGKAAFHCERRARVLLRDIFLFGTATVLLLLLLDGVRRRRPTRFDQVSQSGPPRVDRGLGMAAVEIRQSGTTLDAQARTVVLAQRRERQRQNDRVAQRRSDVDEVTDKSAHFFVIRRFGLGVGVQLLQFDLNRRGHGFETPSALTYERSSHEAGNEHTLHHGLKPQIEGELGAGRHPDHFHAEMLRSRIAALYPTHRARSAAQLASVDHEGLSGVKTCGGAVTRHGLTHNGDTTNVRSYPRAVLVVNGPAICPLCEPSFGP